MKKLMTGTLVIGALLASTPVFAQQTFRMTSACEMLMSGHPQEWRAAKTQGATSKPVKTSVEREEWLQQSQKAMLDFLYKEEDTPEMVFAQEAGVTATAPAVSTTNSLKNTIPLNFTADGKAQGFHYDRVPRIDVTGLGSSGVLRGTLLLPVSGHTGIPNAESWSKTDTYEVRLMVDRVETTIARGPSLGMVTAQDIEIQMVPGKVYSVLYYRSGSGGPGGYSDGRTYDIVWDGK